MEPYLGEIRIFGGNFAPRNWALCNGQLLAISQNTALFSLLGVYYGGNGATTFALPNLQACVPMNHGQGPGLSPRNIGESGGQHINTLTQANMPAHTHAGIAVNDGASVNAPDAGHYLAAAAGSRGQRGPAMYSAGIDPVPVALPFNTLSNVGGSVPFNNTKPVLSISYIICLQGIFPPRAD